MVGIGALVGVGFGVAAGLSRQQEELEARRHLLTVEKESILESARRGLIGLEAADELVGELNDRLRKIDDGL